jgi:poly-gamma-glutamate capsule biosynthesis protein CapA/YwtB (metallophosphatase superfamily)
VSVLRASARTALLSLCSAAAFAVALPATADDAITIVLAGDTGLGGDGQRVYAKRAVRHGTRHAFADLTKDIADHIDGDLAFANLETVVTDRNDLRAQRKAFVFRTHPDGVAHLVARGFNLFSTANNHVGDYGRAGIEATIASLEALKSEGLEAAAGVGRTRAEAGRPQSFDTRGRRFALSAVGIGGGRTNEPGKPGYPGQMAYSEDDDFAEVVQRLGDEKGYRILSVHYGSELDVTPGAQHVRKLRDKAVREAGIDLVVGHHAHVAAGVQEVDGRLIFYGLGNFLHLGTQDMSRRGRCRDYGLLARVHVALVAGGHLKARAVEVVPITGMHLAPKPMRASQASKRIAVLNGLARGLDDEDANARGLRFVAQPDGSGLYCFPNADLEPGRIGALCRGWAHRAAEQAGSVQAAACGHARPQYASGRDEAPARRRKPKSSAGDTILKSLFGF